MIWWDDNPSIPVSHNVKRNIHNPWIYSVKTHNTIHIPCFIIHGMIYYSLFIFLKGYHDACIGAMTIEY